MTSLKKTRSQFILCGLLALLAYTASGRVGILLAIPPGYATAIFPPSGIAVATLLLLGNAAWPFIMGGSFLLNAWMTLDAPAWSSVAVAAGISVGASLQALCGASLVRRFVGYPTALNRERDVALFLGLAGPIACLINSTIGPLALLVAGAIRSDELLKNMGTWWIGDTLGVLVLAPIALIAAAEPRPLWRRRAASVGAPLAVSLALVTTLFVHSSASEQKAIEKEFHTAASDLAGSVAKVLASYRYALSAFERHFYVSGDVSRAQFTELVSPTIAGDPSLRAISWVPIVPHDRLPAFEAAAQTDWPGFAAFARDAEGRRYPLTEERDHAVVLYSEPSDKSAASIIGYDLSSEAVRREAVERATHRKGLQVMRLAQLFRDKKAVPALVLMQPVMRKGDGPDARPAGLLTAAVLVDAVLAAAMRGETPEGLAPSFVDTPPPSIGPRHHLSALIDIPLGEQMLHLYVKPGPSYTPQTSGRGAWAFMVLGLLFTALLGAFVLASTGRSFEKEVEALNFRRLADSMPQVIWTALSDGTFDYFNRQWFELMGTTRTKIEPDDWVRNTPPEDSARLKGAWAKALATGKATDLEFRVFDARVGKLRWHLLRIVPLFEHGKPAKWIGTTTDINDQKESEQNFRFLADSISQLVWVARPDGYVTFFNERWTEYTGLTLEETRDTPWLLHADDHAMVHNQWKESCETGRPFDLEYRLRRSDGEYRWQIARAMPQRDETGAIVRWFGTCTDIQEQRLHLEELKRTQRERELLAVREQAAIESSRLKSEFLAHMSHEIRTPINGVLGMLGILLDSPLTEEQRECADAARRSGDALLCVINDILDFSKIEAGKLALEEIDFSLAQVVENARLALSYAARRKGLSLRIELDPALPEAVRGDPSRLRQIITNLLANAVKFTAEGGVRLEARPEGDAIRFDIIDTGIGIEAAAIKRLFRPFTQADSSTTRRFGGTGLGLSIARNLVERMSGRIDVESQVGRGSRFWFTVKLGEATQVVEVADDEVPTRLAGARKARILVVEDVQINQVVAVRLLEKMGHSAHAVANGREALAAVHEATYDLILMDCNMPVMDGFEATRAIRASKSLVNGGLPIVAMTANALSGDRERCLDAGMDDHIPKPVAGRELAAALDRWLGASRHPSYETIPARRVSLD